MRRLLVLFVVSSFLTSAAVAQVIYVNHQGKDSVGVSFAFELKQAIMSAKGYDLLYSDDDKVAHFTVNLDTLDAYVDGVQLQPPRGSASYIAYSVVLKFPRTDCTNGTQGEVLLNHGINIIGSSRPHEAAKGLLAEIDKMADAIRKTSQK